MRKVTFTTTVQHLFSPISALSAEGKSYIIRFNACEILQINQHNILKSKVLLHKFCSKF